MSIDDLLQTVPTFALVLFRVAGMMLFAPLFGSARIPRQLKALLVIILAVGLMPAVTRPPVMPETMWQLALGIGGEMVFGLAMGMVLSFTFIAAQWAGEMIGQQMGLNMSEVFDPQFGAAGSIVGEFYFMLTLVIFLVVGGHHAMLQGVRASFEALPLLTVGMTPSLLDTLVGLLQSAATLAIQLAGPMFVTMLVVDVAMGFISKTMPQLNVMSAGLSMKSIIGMCVLLVGMTLTSHVIKDRVTGSMEAVSHMWVGLAPSP
ncbi:MAG TPA: flagellar biosynthetic protein FliR [Tepidisphaeraceae bacterium]|nr:flagellar biosynthetic protein FliR [Tepidisphaeraceae bacterium]